MSSSNYHVGDWIAFYWNGVLTFDRVEYVGLTTGGGPFLSDHALLTISHATIDPRAVIDVRRAKCDRCASRKD